MIEGIQADNIAKWDGSTWSPLGSGLNDQVNALAISGDDLYAGGEFTEAGGVEAHFIAKWDGTAWSPLGSGTDYYVRSIAISGDYLYAGGLFTEAGGIEANHIAKWDGTAWSSLGSGMSDDVYALAVLGNSLYAGGRFTTAGGKVSAYLARAFLDGMPPLEVVDGRATVFFRVLEGQYRIDRSTELNTWEPLATRWAGATGGIDFVDENAPDFAAFYRAVRVGP